MAGASILAVLRLVAVETRQHPFPLLGLGSKGASRPYMANELVVATLFIVPRWRLYQYSPLLLCAGCRWIPLVFVSNTISFRFFQYIEENNTKFRLGGGAIT